ncbi:MAG: PIN domain-containing protein [Caldithrix sp.]|nr:PIN domain-containing protein [Caldithrix sp.]
MEKYFIDTNLFIRYLTDDIPEQAQKVENLFRQAFDGKIRLIVHPLVFAEIVWTLESFYKYPKKSIDEIVSPLVASKVFEVIERDILLQALDYYHTLNIDFIDAYIGSWMIENNIDNIFTFNRKHFKRFEELNSVKP